MLDDAGNPKPPLARQCEEVLILQFKSRRHRYGVFVETRRKDYAAVASKKSRLSDLKLKTGRAPDFHAHVIRRADPVFIQAHYNAFVTNFDIIFGAASFGIGPSARGMEGLIPVPEAGGQPWQSRSRGRSHYTHQPTGGFRLRRDLAFRHSRYDQASRKVSGRLRSPISEASLRASPLNGADAKQIAVGRPPLFLPRHNRRKRGRLATSHFGYGGGFRCHLEPWFHPRWALQQRAKPGKSSIAQ
jgi:hypothetical protein